METTQFLGLDCIRLKNESVELLVTKSVGPRLIRFSLLGGQNILAELPDRTLECPDAGQLHLRGGHRLWYAPELPRWTYLPDDEPLTINEIENGLELIQPVEEQTGIQKSMRISLPDETATVKIEHRLTNRGNWSVELAPWAITMLKPGGVAILPQNPDPVDPHSVLPNRHVVLWPYTDIHDSRLQWENRFIFLHVREQEGKFKLGFSNPAGWLAYRWNDLLFVKQADYLPDAHYPDLGSSTECFCRAEFIELETLGPQARLEPEGCAIHTESWQLLAGVPFEPTEEAAQVIADIINGS